MRPGRGSASALLTAPETRPGSPAQASPLSQWGGQAVALAVVLVQLTCMRRAPLLPTRTLL